MLEGMHAAKDVSIRKTCRELRGNQKIPPHIEMYLSCTQCPLSLSLYLFMFLCLSLSLTHSSSTVQLRTESLSYAAQGPRWGPSLGSRTKQRRWCYQNAARRLSARIGPGWPSGRLADVCRCQAPSAFPSADICCVYGKAAEFVCGCILILHLFGSSHAWPSKPAALLALLVLIALAWLAVCFWLHSLISIPQEAATTIAAFRQAHTHIHKCLDSFPHACMGRHECIFGWTQLSFMVWNSQHSLNWCLCLVWQNPHSTAIIVQNKAVQPLNNYIWAGRKVLFSIFPITKTILASYRAGESICTYVDNH